VACSDLEGDERLNEEGLCHYYIDLYLKLQCLN